MSLFTGKVLCEACSKKCSGNVLRVGQTYFHIGETLLVTSSTSAFFSFFSSSQQTASDVKVILSNDADWVLIIMQNCKHFGRMQELIGTRWLLYPYLRQWHDVPLCYMLPAIFWRQMRSLQPLRRGRSGDSTGQHLPPKLLSLSQMQVSHYKTFICPSLLLRFIYLFIYSQSFATGEKVTWTGKECLCAKCIQIPVVSTAHNDTDTVAPGKKVNIMYNKAVTTCWLSLQYATAVKEKFQRVKRWLP